MLESASKSTISIIRSCRRLGIDMLLAVILIFVAYRIEIGSQQGSPLDLSVTWQIISGAHWVFKAWCIVAVALLTLARTRPVWPCWGLPILLLIHLLLFSVTLPAVVVTFYAMVILGRFAVPRWRRIAVLTALVGTSAAVFFRGGLYPEWTVYGVALVTSWLSLGFFWQWGARMRDRDLELKSLKDRAALAAISERTRIAREMHDIVAHSLTAIIVQADGGRYAGKNDPEKALATLNTIADTARDSLMQMRGLLSVLRNGAEESARQSAPGITEIPQLITEARNNGLDIEYRIQGKAYALDPTRALTIYRIIQECLTNAMRHSGSNRVEIDIVWGAKEIVIVIYNDLPDIHQGTWSGGTRRGLIGIRERAELHGGKIEISQHDGFTVTAWIPRK